jgi:hypothetical protein
MMAPGGRSCCPAARHHPSRARQLTEPAANAKTTRIRRDGGAIEPAQEAAANASKAGRDRVTDGMRRLYGIAPDEVKFIMLFDS